MEPKRLYRSLTDRKFAGVAGGLAEYLNMDPLLIRLIFVVLTISAGAGVPIYIVLWIVTPEKPIRIQSSTDQPPRDYQEPTYETSGNPNESPKTGTVNSTTSTSSVQQNKEQNKGSLIGGLVLITLGGLFLAAEFIPRVDFWDLWPVILIVIGIGLLFNTLTGRKQNIN